MRTLRPNGFTLIEMMIALAIVAVMAGMAGPSFQTAVNTSRIASSANELSAAVHLARSEAIRSNLYKGSVVLCRSDDMSTCTAGSGAWKGWIVFIDTNDSSQRDDSEEIVRNGAIDSPMFAFASSNIVALDNRIAFRSDGRARGSDGLAALNGTLELCMASSYPADNARELNIAFGGRTTVLKKNTNGVCAPPTDS